MSKEPTLQQIWDFVKSETNSATDYEIGVMNAILGTTLPKDSWRFKKGIHCERCNRELTILDYFLTGVQHHTLSGIKEFLSPGESNSAKLEFSVDTDKLVKYDTTDHPNPIACVSCGHVNPLLHDVYGHPVAHGEGIHVRMPQDLYNKIASQI
jgi:hypothetical protein